MIQPSDLAMENIKEFFVPFIGDMVWQVRRGYGSFLTMEFGLPHLAVREPIFACPGATARVRRNLERRAVAVVGDCHFWVNMATGRL
jgi:hypothetical protein